MSTPLDEHTTERDFLQLVLDYARLRGWLCYHTHRSDHSEAGFPDLVMVRDGKLIFAELKRQGALATEPQTLWARALAEVENVQCCLWWPSHWKSIEEELL